MSVRNGKYESLSDENLMGLIARKEVQAFEELYERYSSRMVNYFYGMLWKDQEKAQDFMQELFTRIVEKPQRFDVNRNFKTWVFSVANNMCKNEYRKQSVRKGTNHEMPLDVEGDGAGSVSSHIDKNSFNEALSGALQELDEVKKSTFMMRYYDEMSVKEISEIMKCSEGTVKSRLFYTLKALNGKLKVFEGIGLVVSYWLLVICY